MGIFILSRAGETRRSQKKSGAGESPRPRASSFGIEVQVLAHPALAPSLEQAVVVDGFALAASRWPAWPWASPTAARAGGAAKPT